MDMDLRKTCTVGQSLLQQGRVCSQGWQRSLGPTRALRSTAGLRAQLARQRSRAAPAQRVDDIRRPLQSLQLDGRSSFFPDPMVAPIMTLDLGPFRVRTNRQRHAAGVQRSSGRRKAAAKVSLPGSGACGISTKTQLEVSIVS